MLRSVQNAGSDACHCDAVPPGWSLKTKRPVALRSLPFLPPVSARQEPAPWAKCVLCNPLTEFSAVPPASGEVCLPSGRNAAGTAYPAEVHTSPPSIALGSLHWRTGRSPLTAVLPVDCPGRVASCANSQHGFSRCLPPWPQGVQRRAAWSVTQPHSRKPGDAYAH